MSGAGRARSGRIRRRWSAHALSWSATELLHEVAGGGVEAFGRLYDVVAGPMFEVALGITGDVATAEVVTHRAMLEIWRRAGCWDRERADPLRWVRLLAAEHARAHLRRQASASCAAPAWRAGRRPARRGPRLRHRRT